MRVKLSSEKVKAESKKQKVDRVSVLKRKHEVFLRTQLLQIGF